MKVAVSIPDHIFEEAEYLARQLGKARSQLYADAIAEYVGVYRSDAITEQLNAVYGKDDARLDPVMESAQFQSLGKGDW